MQRRDLLAVSGSLLAGSGCLDTQSGAEDASPTAGATPTTTDESTSETASETPDCRFVDLYISNDQSNTATVSVRLIEGRGRYRGGSPTRTRAESPTETPTVIFEAEPTIPAEDSQTYKELPDAEGTHRLEVAVVDGPSETDHLRPDKWSGPNAVFVDIDQRSIRFTYSTGDPSTECAGRAR